MSDWGRDGPRLGEHFVLAYLTLYLFPFPLGWVAGTEAISSLYDNAWASVVPWVGAHVLHLRAPITILPNGSGDTTFNYVQVLCILALAAVAAMGLTMAQRGTGVTENLRGFVRVYVRFGLGAIMFSYGSAKFFHLQFPAPSPGRLIEPYGESSPMGLLWTFMGASTAYLVFSGVMEAVSGVLLFWRRTVLLGAVASSAALANIVALNFSYDVPVKLFSMHLLAMALFLMAPDAWSLLDLFLLHRAARSRRVDLGPASLRARGIRAIVKGVLVLAILGGGVYSTVTQWQAARKAPRVLDGVYEVERWGTSATDHWQRMGVGHRNFYISAVDSHGRMIRYAVDHDLRKRSIVLREYVNPVELKAGAIIAELTYAQADERHVTLRGTFRGSPAQIDLTRLDDSTFPLTNRRFHWISEYPFNR